LERSERRIRTSAIKKEDGAPFCIPLARGGSVATPLPRFAEPVKGRVITEPERQAQSKSARPNSLGASANPPWTSNRCASSDSDFCRTDVMDEPSLQAQKP
jgi:hypothetical protein